MKYSTEKFMVACGCRSAGECGHNSFAERTALSALVDDFAATMKVVLLGKLNGKSGWDDPAWTVDELEHQLLDHAVKAMERRRTGTTRMNDAVDIANFAAFLWNKTTDGYVNTQAAPILNESSPVAVEGEKETLWRCNDQDFGLSKITTNRQLAVDGAELYGAILQSSIDGGKTWIDADVQASEEERS